MIVTQPVTTKFNKYEERLYLPQGAGGLKIGQILGATTLTNSSHGVVNLRIGEAVVLASTNIALQRNTNLSLQVAQVHPQLLLRLVSPVESRIPTDALREAMSGLLPRQSGFIPLLAELVHSTILNQSNNSQFMRSLGKALINVIPSRKSITNSEGLQRAILQSGIFLEAKLAKSDKRHKAGISTDLKAHLVRLLGGYSQLAQNPASVEDQQTRKDNMQYQAISPPLSKSLPINQPGVSLNEYSGPQTTMFNGDSLHNRIQGALARIILLQIATAQNFSDGQVLWQLEFPVRHDEYVDIVSMSIEHKHNNQKTNKGKAWIINIALDLANMGPLQIHISMYDEGVSSTFWSESFNTLSLIKNSLALLSTSLEQQGIKTLNMHCQKGKQPVPDYQEANTSIFDVQV